MTRAAIVLAVLLLASPVAAQDVPAGAESLDLPAEIARTCNHRWPDDFVMKEHCAKAQRLNAALVDQVAQAWGKPGHERAGFVRTCLERWLLGQEYQDYEMAYHCLQQQNEAFNRQQAGQ